MNELVGKVCVYISASAGRDRGVALVEAVDMPMLKLGCSWVNCSEIARIRPSSDPWEIESTLEFHRKQVLLSAYPDTG